MQVASTFDRVSESPDFIGHSKTCLTPPTAQTHIFLLSSSFDPCGVKQNAHVLLTLEIRIAVPLWPRLRRTSARAAAIHLCWLRSTAHQRSFLFWSHTNRKKNAFLHARPREQLNFLCKTTLPTKCIPIQLLFVFVSLYRCFVRNLPSTDPASSGRCTVWVHTEQAT